MNLALALALLGGGTLIAWAGLADPPGGVSGALSRVLSGRPAGGHKLTAHAQPATASGQVPKLGTARAWPTTSHTVTEAYHVPNARYAAGYHTGEDFAAAVGAPVFAPVAGLVTQAGFDTSSPAYGNTVQIKAGPYLVMLAHLSDVSAHLGQHVTAGQRVGSAGSTGNSTGPHVHLEVRKAPFSYGSDVNPAVVLP